MVIQGFQSFPSRFFCAPLCFSGHMVFYFMTILRQEDYIRYASEAEIEPFFASIRPALLSTFPFGKPGAGFIQCISIIIMALLAGSLVKAMTSCTYA